MNRLQVPSFRNPLTLLSPQRFWTLPPADSMHVENIRPETWPTPESPECGLRELRKLNSREAEHTRAPGSAPERTAQKQTARSRQALAQRPRRNVRLGFFSERKQLPPARTSRNDLVAAEVHEWHSAQSHASPRCVPIP